jgi:hypothetical protein
MGLLRLAIMRVSNTALPSRCAEEFLHDGGPSERRSHFAHQAAKPHVIAESMIWTRQEIA